MMWLTHTAVAKPLAIVAIFIAVVAAGVASFFALPINLFPSFNVPVVVVTTAWPARDGGRDHRITAMKANERAFSTNATSTLPSANGGRFAVSLPTA